MSDWNYALVYDFGGTSDGFGGTGNTETFIPRLRAVVDGAGIRIAGNVRVGRLAGEICMK